MNINLKIFLENKIKPFRIASARSFSEIINAFFFFASDETSPDFNDPSSLDIFS